MATIKNKLNLLNWNANSIKNKKDELLHILNDFKIDIAFITETKLQANIKFKLPGYQVYRKDRNTNGGGVAIVAKKSLQHFEVQCTKTLYLETCAIKLKYINKYVTLICAYNPPQNKKFLIKRELNKLFKMDKSVIMCGDFNAKHLSWNCPVNNRSGNILNNFIINTDMLLLHPYDYTFYPETGGRPSTLDLIICKNVPSISTPVTHTLTESDHNPVLFTLDSNNICLKEPPPLSYKNTRWPDFRSQLDTLLPAHPHILTTEQLEHSTSVLTNAIQKSLKNNTPLTPAPIIDTSLPADIIMLINRKNKFRKFWQQTRNKLYKRQANQLKTIIADKISSHNTEKWSKLLHKLNIADNSVWQLRKKLNNQSIQTPPLHGKRGMVFSPTDKANCIADTLESITRNNENLGINFENAIKLELNNAPLNDNIKPEHTHIKEITCAIKAMRPNKAPGPDLITNLVLRNLSRKALNFIKHIINAMFQLSYFPDQWKEAVVLPIPKPNKPHNMPQNYRPISLLNTLSKIAEKIILIRLNKHLSANNIIINEQFGFRSKHSTVQQLTRVVEYITLNFNLKLFTGMALLDIEKAFDSVWHTGLLVKLYRYKVPIYLIQLIKSYLHKRIFRVKLENNFSNYHNLHAGVPQGSLLGPVLFLLYINDIPLPIGMKIALYADDTAIMTRSIRARALAPRLQQALVNINEYFLKWKIKINAGKTEAIIFSKKLARTDTNIHFQGKDIEWKNSVKYLGVHLDRKLTFSHHITQAANKGRAAIACLYPLICPKNGVNNDLKKILYTSCVRPIITYASPVWSYASKSNINNLQLVQHKYLRIAYKSKPRVRLRLLHERLQLDSIESTVRKQTESFYNSLNTINTNNTLLSEIGKYDLHDFPFIYKHKMPKHIIILP
jgi:hypothetical protein